MGPLLSSIFLRDEIFIFLKASKNAKLKPEARALISS